MPCLPRRPRDAQRSWCDARRVLRFAWLRLFDAKTRVAQCRLIYTFHDIYLCSPDATIYFILSDAHCFDVLMFRLSDYLRLSFDIDVVHLPYYFRCSFLLFYIIIIIRCFDSDIRCSIAHAWSDYWYDDDCLMPLFADDADDPYWWCLRPAMIFIIWSIILIHIISSLSFWWWWLFILFYALLFDVLIFWWKIHDDFVSIFFFFFFHVFFFFLIHFMLLILIFCLWYSALLFVFWLFFRWCLFRFFRLLFWLLIYYFDYSFFSLFFRSLFFYSILCLSIIISIIICPRWCRFVLSILSIICPFTMPVLSCRDPFHYFDIFIYYYLISPDFLFCFDVLDAWCHDAWFWWFDPCSSWYWWCFDA